MYPAHLLYCTQRPQLLPQTSFILSLHHAPPHHYLVGFCKEGSLLREYVSLLQSLLITPLFLSNTQQVSVLIVQALGKRK